MSEEPTNPIDPEQMPLVAARAADSKGATDTVVLEVGDILGLTSEFVITGARNQRLVRAVVEEVELKIKEAGGPSPHHVEGLDDPAWVLMDYRDFVVHIFLDESREAYDLERLWSDVPRIDWQLPADGDAAAI